MCNGVLTTGHLANQRTPSSSSSSSSSTQLAGRQNADARKGGTLAENLLAKQEEVGGGKVSKRVQREERGREKERDSRQPCRHARVS